MYTLKAEVFPSFLIILLGSIDCITILIGVMYYGASELNPFMTGIVNSSMVGFLILKISATFLIGFTYIYAKRILNKAMDKSTKVFKVSCKVMKGVYARIMIFLIIAVINNLIVLIG
jgi:membrane protein DedA with SNARE-associated domain